MSPRRAKAVRGRVADDPATALREHLIDTAQKLLAERQVGTITTRDIARAAGVSDGVLYNYFADKHELVVAALIRRYAGSVSRFEADLPAPGSGSVEENLITYTRAAVDLVADTLPSTAGLMSEPALLHRFVAEIHQEPFGPHRLREPMATYLRGEQELGRLGAFDVESAISLVMGPALMLGFAAHVSGTPRDELAAQIPPVIRTLLAGLDP